MELDYLTVELSAGDMLFVPRHWWHSVISLDEVNVNVNWVWTDLATGPNDNPTAARDTENLKLLYYFNRLMEPIPEALRPRLVNRLLLTLAAEDYIKNFGGSSDYVLARQYFGDVGPARLFSRFVTEMSSFIRYYRLRKQNAAEVLRRNDGVSRRADDYFIKKEGAGK